MNNTLLLILIALVGLSILAIIIYLLRKKLKKVKSLKSDIPQDVLADFEKAEQMYKESGGDKTPQKILWEIYKSKNERRFNNGKTKINQISASSTASASGELGGIGKRRGRPRGRRTSGIVTSEANQEAISRTGIDIVKAYQPGISRAELPKQPGRREDIQGTPATNIRQDERNIPEAGKDVKRKPGFRWKLK